MSYLRGDQYLWTDSDDRLHIWVADGYDGWDQSVWAMNAEGTARRESREHASGVSIPETIMDECVVMRVAQLLAAGTVASTIDRAVAPGGQGGNFGGAILKHNADKLTAAFGQMQLDQRNAPSGNE